MPPAHASEPYGTGSLLECLHRHGTAPATAPASPAESTAHPVAQVPIFQSLGCMQRLLREGGMNLDFQDGCVPAPACPKFGCFFSSSKSQRFLVAVGSRTRSPSPLAFPRVGAAARAAGGMTEYSEYPHQVPQAAGWSKNKKNPGLPPWAARRVTDGYRLRGSGLPPGPHRPLPRLCSGMG